MKMENVVEHPKRIHDTIAIVTMKTTSIVQKMTSLITPQIEVTFKVNWRIKMMNAEKMVETSILAIRKKAFDAPRRIRSSIIRRRRNRITTAEIVCKIFMVTC